MLENIEAQTRKAVADLCEAAKLRVGDLMVVGCSSSEVIGRKIGTDSSVETAQAILGAVTDELEMRGISLAAQCCEHLNRALIVEREVAERFGLEIVNAVPQPKAGGSFATAAYQGFREAVAVDSLHKQAKAGIDIGGTLIGMHLKEVAVPVRLEITHIGEAIVLYARTRPKFVGGERAQYNQDLM